MNKFPKDLTGERFGKLVVLNRVPKPEHLKKKDETYWSCMCDCGNNIIIQRSGLTSKNTKSCGCLRKDNAYKKHGMSETRFYKIWTNMKSRCHNSNTPNYIHYGAKGVIVCDEWHEFTSFYNDMYSDYVSHVELHGERNTTIDRIDVNGIYESSNCKWSTIEEQCNNKRKPS